MNEQEKDIFETFIKLLKGVWVEKACEWLKHQDEMIGVSFQEDFIERFKEEMEK